MMDLLTGVVIDYMAAQVRSLKLTLVPLQFRPLQSCCFARLASFPAVLSALLNPRR